MPSTARRAGKGVGNDCRDEVGAARRGAKPVANVLVIDDSVHIRDLVRTILELAGHSVAVACNGLAGMAQFRSSPPELVITDIAMPEQEGFETVRQMRHADPAVKII